MYSSGHARRDSLSVPVLRAEDTASKMRVPERERNLLNGNMVPLDMFEQKFAEAYPSNLRPPDFPFRWSVAPSQTQLFNFGGYNSFHHGAMPCPGTVGTLPSQHAMDPFYDWNQQVMFHRAPGLRPKPAAVNRLEPQSKTVDARYDRMVII